MSCRHLTGNYMLSCTARREVYVPSGFEFDEYCKSSRYKLCPLYDQDRPQETGRRISPPAAVCSAPNAGATTEDRFTRETRTRYGRFPY